MGPSVWNTGGCSSWYLDEHGKNTVIWPRTTFAFRQLLGRFDVAAYDDERRSGVVTAEDPGA